MLVVVAEVDEEIEGDDEIERVRKPVTVLVTWLVADDDILDECVKEFLPVRVTVTIGVAVYRGEALCDAEDEVDGVTVIEIEELALLEVDGECDSAPEELVDPLLDPKTEFDIVGVLVADGLEVPEAVCVATALVDEDAVTRRTEAVEFTETLGLEDAVCVMTLEREFDDVILIDGELEEEIEAEVLSENEPMSLFVCA